MCSPLLRSDTYLPDTMTIYEDTDMGYSMRYRLNSERYPLQHPQYFNHPLLLPLPPLTHRRHFTNSTPPCRHTLHSPPSLTPPRSATLLRNHRVQLTQHPPTRRRPESGAAHISTKSTSFPATPHNSKLSSKI